MQIQGRFAGVDPELLRAAHGAQHLSGLEELLRGDAALVQAHPTHPSLLDEDHPESGGRSGESGGIAPGPTAQDDDVVVLGHSFRPFPRTDLGARPPLSHSYLSARD